MLEGAVIMKKVSFRIRNFENEKFLTFNIDNEAELDEELLDFLEEDEPAGIVPIIFEEGDEFDTFSYNVTDKIRLSELSNQEINAEMVLMVLRGIAMALVDMAEYRVPLAYLVLHRDYIYIDSDYKVEYICIPLEEMKEEVDINSFLRSFLSTLRFEPSENGDYVAKLFTYINNPEIFNLHNLILLVEELMENMGLDIPDGELNEIYADYQEVEDVVEEEEVPQEHTSTLSDEEFFGNGIKNDSNEEEDVLAAVDEAEDMDDDIVDDVLEDDVEGEVVDDNLENDVVDEEVDDVLEADIVDEEPDDITEDDSEEAEIDDEVQNILDNIKQVVSGEVEEEVLEEEKPSKKSAFKTKETEITGVVIQDELDEFLAEKELEDRLAEKEEGSLKIKKNIKVSRASIVQNTKDEIQAAEAEDDETDSEEEVVSNSILSQSVGATGILKGGTMPKANPYLIRVNTDERIMITKATFKVGKASMGVDYTVKGNGAVSRIHAIITNKDDVYYIKDNKSTNHTFVNGKIIEEGDNELLTHDCKIVLGDEEFVFKLR